MRYNARMTEHKSTHIVRTRIAPSPTGQDIHIGNLYTALMNFAYAKKMKGNFIVRIEDTDRTRLVEGAIDKIISSLYKFGLTVDEGPLTHGPFGPYIQSERLPLYQKYAAELIEKNKAYYCFCSKERLVEIKKEQGENTHVRHYDLCTQEDVEEKKSQGIPYVIRLKVPKDYNISFVDLIRGNITIHSDQIDDQILIKSDGFPTYHMAVVVDDYLMQISHVIRAEEWISSTPKHILLYEAFGWELPTFVHLPILRNPDKSKLSKRKNPVWASWYLEEGYFPEAVLNYLALMGWSHPEEKEIFSLEEFISVFDLNDISAVGPVFDIVKLTWMNQQYIQRMEDDVLGQRIQAFYQDKKFDETIIKQVLPLIKTRMETLKDFERLTQHFFEDPTISTRNDVDKRVVNDLLEQLESIENWEALNIFPTFKSIMEKNSVRMPVLYYLLTGEERGLPLPESLEILGKERTLSRLRTIK